MALRVHSRTPARDRIGEKPRGRSETLGLSDRDALHGSVGLAAEIAWILRDS